MENIKEISGHKVLKKLGESIHAEVFKVQGKGEPDHPLVLKMIKPKTRSNDIESSIKHQVDYLKTLDLPGMLVPTNYLLKDGSLFLVYDYFDGLTLSDWRKSQTKISLSDFFEIGCRLSKILGYFHDAGSFHGGIKPSNILIEPNTLDVRIIDPVRITDINEVSHFIFDEGFRVGTLSYISPEQTGRISQYVEYTTDFYSLGIVLYELISGTSPFSSEDPMEVIHSHLADDPVPLNQVKDDIPQAVSSIVVRLLQKEPEKRYQTMKGLLFDLMHCQKKFNHTGEIPSFQIGRKDYSNRINLPSIMVGRDREKELLLKEHALSCSGHFRSAIISGLPGIGKTRLIQELQRPIIEKRGYFISGKYDQYRGNVPYSMLIQAFRNLMRTFLSEDTERITYWKKTISEALEPNGKVIADLIPELELIIGKQPEVAQLPPVEAQNRFNNTTERFISCLASEEHPLTLFFDDVQWADTDTFDIFENLYLNAKDHPCLFLLGAYRDNEIYPGHPLERILKTIREMKGPLLELHLDRLNKNHCIELVSYILDIPLLKTEALAEVIYATSEGNPLHVNESLSWLYDGKLIDITQDGTWRWDNERIMRSKIPETTIALFTDKIKKLSPEVRKILSFAACLGASFKTEDLSLITGVKLTHLYKDLTPAFQQKVLTRRKDYISFFHDRVQEAVDKGLDDARRRSIHKRIAEVFIQAIPKGADPESLDNLFDIVEHLNKGRETGIDKETLQRYAVFNYHAGRKAMDALALDAANRYLRESKGLLPEDSWEKDYDFTFMVYKNLAKSELTQGNQEQAGALLDLLLEKSKTDMDRAECLAEQSTSLLSIGEYQCSIDLANQGLAYFGKAIPDDEEYIPIKINELAVLIKEAGISMHEILDKEPLSSRRDSVELGLYNLMIPAYYLSGRQMELTLAGLQATYLSLFAGINEKFIYPLVYYMLFLIDQGVYEDAFDMEDIIVQLCRKFPNTFGQTRGLNGIAWLSSHLREHPLEVIKSGLKTVESGKRSGDIFHAGMGYCAAFWAAVLQCRDLNQIEDYVLECEDYSRKNSLTSEGIAKGMKAAWVEPMKTQGQEIPIQRDIEIWRQSQDFFALGNYYVHSGVTRYFMGDHRGADEDLRQGEDCLIGLAHTIPYKQWHIFSVFNSLRLLEEEPADYDMLSTFGKIEPIIEKIEFWSRFGPAVRPHLALIRAELKRVTGTFSEARALYLDAIDIAHEQEYTLLEGHIHECIGDLLSKHGNRQAKYHINEAANLFDLCHAYAKQKRLKEKFPQYFTSEYKEKTEETPLSQRLDTIYLMEVSRDISQELDIERLLKTILRSVMERLGAKEGYILTKDGESLIIRAYGVKDKTIEVFVKEEPLNDSSGISQGIVRYVQRTKERLILDDAINEGPFVGDREVQELKLRSVLCYPIMKKKKMLGILYLENRLLQSVFAREDIDLVNLLGSQAAISIENAELIDNMKRVEQKIMASLKEKEALLKEVHHRVKNNMQLISSLFKLQSRYVRDKRDIEIFKDSQERIKSMAIIHERLYQSKDMANIDFAEYVKTLTNRLFRSYNIDPARISMKTDIGDVMLGVDRAIPCGLIINELISNSLKHAFPEGRKGEIRIAVHPMNEDEVELVFADNGVGLKEGLDVKNTESMGLQLVRTLVEQLEGEMETDNKRGLRFNIKFKNS